MKVKMYERKDTIVNVDAGVVVTRLVGLKCPAKELVSKGRFNLGTIMCSSVGDCITRHNHCDRYACIKGVAKCMPCDEFSENKGRLISETKAQQKHYAKLEADYRRMSQLFGSIAVDYQDQADEYRCAKDERQQSLAAHSEQKSEPKPILLHNGD